MPNRTTDFRYFFANTLGLAWSDNDCKLIFGVDEGGGAESTLEQTGVIMTHKTAKLLSMHLTAIIKGFEEHSGQEIPFDADKQESLRVSLEEANRAASAL